MTKDNILLIVDPQNDFVDPRGSLYVPRSEEALDEIINHIYSGKYDRIIVTMDTHQDYHIGHTGFWENIEPFSKINKEDIECGKVVPAHTTQEELDRIREEVIKEISRTESGEICVWPKHCIVGTWGHNFPKNLSIALNYWSVLQRKSFEVYQKGMNPYKESYSLLDDVIPDFKNAENIMVCGFCRDICVYNTFKALLNCGDDIIPFNTHMEVLKQASATLSQNSEFVDKKYEELCKLHPERFRFEG